jgi:hypothetical protein
MSSTAKWIGMLLLQIPVYLVTSYVMRSLAGGSYNLLIKAGANLPPNLLLQHFLFVAIADGLLAGLLGVLTIRAMLLLPNRIRAVEGPAWKRPQVWTWTISTCWFAFGIFVWIAANAHPSVLVTSSGLRLSDFIAAFFGRGCDLSAPKIDLSVVQTCMNQISYTHLWLGTIGYSAAAFVPAGWSNRLKNSTDSAEQLAASTEGQSPVQQAQPGEALK